MAACINDVKEEKVYTYQPLHRKLHKRELESSLPWSNVVKMSEVTYLLLILLIAFLSLSIIGFPNWMIERLKEAIKSIKSKVSIITILGQRYK